MSYLKMQKQKHLDETDLRCQEMSHVLKLDKTSDKVSETQIMWDLDQTSHHIANTALSRLWLVALPHGGFSLVNARILLPGTQT